jgi:limonene-1,2-epoxide hydrolase
MTQLTRLTRLTRRRAPWPVANGSGVSEVSGCDHPSIFGGCATVHTSVETVQAFIAAFKKAWPTADATVLGSYFHEDARYHNGPLDPVVGRAAIVATFTQFMNMGGHVDVDIIHMVAEGPIVMTERVDYLTRDDGTTVSLPMMGMIEVHDGLIDVWRDYFDLSQFTSQMLGGN